MADVANTETGDQVYIFFPSHPTNECPPLSPFQYQSAQVMFVRYAVKKVACYSLFGLPVIIQISYN
jgi:hypothetical protein